MKIDGSKNIICLISSYKFTSNKISKIIIDMEDSPKEFIINNSWFLDLILLSTNGYNDKPNKIIKGNLKKNQMGI